MGNTYRGIGKEVPMPWQETCVMDERMAFIGDWQSGEWAVAELCRQYGISRKTGYKLLARFAAEGVDGLKERSRAPHHHPNAVSEAVAQAVVAVRTRHPRWGPKKIRAFLARKRPEAMWPAESTIAALLDREGLVKRRRVRRHVPPNLAGLSACAAANDVWGVDFKGWFRLGNGERCEPLSLSDLASRYVLRLQAVARPDTAHVWPIFDAAFREFGPPKAMRSDNGPPFASSGAGGLTALAVRLIKAGIVPERIAPGRPQQNGRHERLHLTVQQETASPPAANRGAQQRRFDAFRRVFNEERPHEALGQLPPAAVYSPPTHAYSGRLREPEYDADHVVRRVRQNGEIKWNGDLIFIGQALIGEPVGLVESDDDCWRLHYGPLELGQIDPGGTFTRLKAGARSRLEPQPQPPG